MRATALGVPRAAFFSNLAVKPVKAHLAHDDDPSLSGRKREFRILNSEITVIVFQSP